MSDFLNGQSDEQKALWAEVLEAQRVYEEVRDRWHKIRQRDEAANEEKRILELVETRLKEREAARG